MESAFDLQGIDILLRAATAAIAFSAAAAILLRPARHEASGYAAFAVGGIGAFMIASAPGAHAALGLGAFAFNAWCLATPVAIWLLARVLFGEGVRPGAASLAFGGALVALTMLGDYGRYQLGLLEDRRDVAGYLLLGGRAVAIALLAAACLQAVRHWRADLVEQRRRLRAAFIGVIGTVFAASAASEFVFDGRTPLELLVAAHAALFALAFAVLQLVARGAMEALLPAAAHVPASPAALTLVRTDTSEAGLARRVTEAMDAQRLWKREGLGIAALAQVLGTQEYLLRRAINRHLGYRNFNDFLHDYRLREASRRLADPAEAHLPVLSIALDCGYGSIGPFNRAFKARFGVTPTQFRVAAVPPASAQMQAGSPSPRG